MNKYELIWTDGRMEIIEGERLGKAVVNAGYSLIDIGLVHSWRELPIDDE